MPQPIHCRTLGPVEVRIGEDAAPPELLWRKHLALLVYLARSPGQLRTRDHLVGLFWGDKPEASARHSLNEALRILRRCGGEDAVDTSAGRIRLVEGAVRLDVDELETLAGTDVAAAAALATGEFLEGFGVADASDFEDWLSAERAHWRQVCVQALVAHATQQLATGGDALPLAMRALQLDPASDQACRVSMRAAGLAGDRAGALGLFTSFERRIDEDFGLAPEPETIALAERIRRERARPAPAEDPHLAGRRTRLFGRESELGALLEAWEACRTERATRVAYIEGDAGTGKTRLVEEVVARVRFDGARTVVVRAVEADAGEPWSGAIGLVRGLVAEAVDPRVDVRSALRIMIDEVATALDAGDVLIAFDDAQWLDHETLLGVSALLRELHDRSLCVFLCATPLPQRTELDEIRARMGRDLRGLNIHLGPLRRGALLDLARAALPAYDEIELDRLTRRLGTDSAGIPLLAVELLHAVAIGMDLHGVDNAWPEPMRTLDHTLPGAVPDAITAAIRMGFRKLSRDARTVLMAASVLESRIDRGTLTRATGLDAEMVDHALDELEWNRWLVAEPRGYSFVAAISRAIIARDMTTAGQRQRFREAAEARGAGAG